jgi:hypothetical protein
VSYFEHSDKIILPDGNRFAPFAFIYAAQSFIPHSRQSL